MPDAMAGSPDLPIQSGPAGELYEIWEKGNPDGTGATHALSDALSRQEDGAPALQEKKPHEMELPLKITISSINKEADHFLGK